jgi:hypothetical protein
MFLFFSDFGCAPGAKSIGGFHLRHSPYGHINGHFFQSGLFLSTTENAYSQTFFKE